MSTSNNDQSPKRPRLLRVLDTNIFLIIAVSFFLLIALSIVLTWYQMESVRHKGQGTPEIKLTVILAGSTPQAASTPAEGEAAPPAEQVQAGTVTLNLDQNQAAQLAMQTAEQTLAEASKANDSAQDAVNTVGMLLNFLEGVEVLVGLALGAAAYFGFRGSKEIREEFDSEIKKNEVLKDNVQDLERSVSSHIETFRQEVQKATLRFEAFSDLAERMKQKDADVTEALRSLAEVRATLAQEVAEVQNIELVFSSLLQANHELRLRNYEDAYIAVLAALKYDPDNPLALYFAGWLELQYVHTPDHLEKGTQHLKLALDLSPQWSSAMAAYGVALRRQAVEKSGDEREALLAKAEGYLREALYTNPQLIDLNLESLWGPVAGIQRDRGDFGKAIEAYRKACEVTPGSSYPYGNLATLLLRQGKDDPKLREEALDTFEKTAELAELELVLVPNDYFHIMDIAMARIVLSQRDATLLNQGQKNFKSALDVKPTAEMLGVSRRGWENLLKFCPDEWTELRGHLQEALDQIGEAIDAAQKADERPRAGGK